MRSYPYSKPWDQVLNRKTTGKVRFARDPTTIADWTLPNLW